MNKGSGYTDEAWLAKYVYMAEGKYGISSTSVREKFREGKNGAEEMLHPKVMELMKEVDMWASE